MQQYAGKSAGLNLGNPLRFQLQDQSSKSPVPMTRDRHCGASLGVYTSSVCITTGKALEASAITPEDKVERELMLHRFHQLVMELRSGVINRNNFAPWEIEILQDFGNCGVDPRHRRGILWQYQTAVEQQLEQGSTTPMKVSEFLALQMRVTSPFLQ